MSVTIVLGNSSATYDTYGWHSSEPSLVERFASVTPPVAGDTGDRDLVAAAAVLAAFPAARLDHTSQRQPLPDGAIP